MPERQLRVVQTIVDHAPEKHLTILDLACLEGEYSLELASHGYRVTGIEGRSESHEKAERRRRELGHENVRFLCDDVRNLSREKYGEYDIVLCLGILYHLEAEDALKLIDNVCSVCRRFAIFDTHFSFTPDEKVIYRGQTYTGHSSREHDLSHPWSAIGNEFGLFFTCPSLYNAIEGAGFSSVYECLMPAAPDYPRDRTTLIAIKGRPVTLNRTPLGNRRVWPEVKPYSALRRFAIRMFLVAKKLWRRPFSRARVARGD
jgi:SAM-dependent methyltransferase